MGRRRTPSTLQPDERVLADVAAELGRRRHARGRWSARRGRSSPSRSADLDLLVVGARAYGPVRRLLLGSTSTKLARHAACPLLVAPRALTASPTRRLPPGAATVARSATGN